MRPLLLLPLMVLAACDSTPVVADLEVAPGEFRLDLEGDLRSQATGPARYTLVPDRPSFPDQVNTFVRWAEVAFGTEGREAAVLAFYAAADDRPVPLEPGTYTLDRSSSRFIAQFPLRDRVLTPYEGTITIERATETEIVGSFEVKISSGPGFSSRPTLLSEGRGRFHAVLE